MDWKRILIGKWSWKRPIYSLISIYLIFVVIAVFFADRLIFMPPPPSYGRDLPSLKIIPSSKDETTATIFLKASRGNPTLLFSHGNAEDLGTWLPIFEEWHQMGLGVIAYDYPGYGQSSGTPSESSCQRSITSVRRLLTRHGVPDSSIVIVGRSVGSGPSVWLASEIKAKALILISPFTSTFNVAIPLPFPILPYDRFPNLKRIRTIETPLLIIHGKNDEVIPFSHGEKLFKASPSSQRQIHPIPNAGHNDLFNIAGQEIIHKIASFSKSNY